MEASYSTGGNHVIDEESGRDEDGSHHKGIVELTDAS